MPATTDSNTGNNSKLVANQLSSSTTINTTTNTSTTTQQQQQQLTTQTEKPLHYQYLKEFRCEQCPLFLQHKCTQHKPFTCFYWHFCNQRRRRPIRKRDGTFNYSPDVYCTKYDETTGVCPDGDDCPYLHRTAGDTERRYHLRYYKTGICVYDTDTRGYCVKNGPHCAFAHGLHDLRNPVYDIRELQAMESGGQLQPIDADGNGNIGQNNSNCVPNSLDKERNALNEDPRWQDTAYVLANYKTELCKRPPRLCRQGYACPQFHNNKDRRRSPKKYKYRSTPCPNVKQGDEWGDPSNCENSDGCPYCHTRTEQQFHPEIYKSTKCNDIQQTGYCPRGPFCAFAHIETSEEISAARELSMEGNTDLSALVSNVLPPNNCNTSPVPISRTNSMSSQQTANTLAHNRSNQQSVASSLPEHYQTGGFDLSAPQPPPQLQQHRDIPTPSGLGPIARPRSYSTSTANTSDTYLMSYLEKTNGPSLKNNTASLFSGTSSPLFANLRESAFNLQSGADNSNSYFNPIDAVLNQTLDDLNFEDINMEPNSGGQQNTTSGVISNNNSDNHENIAINNAVNSFGIHRSSSLLSSTQPVNIPGARLGNTNANLTSNLSSPPVGASPLTSSLASGPGGHSTGFGMSSFLQRNNSVGQSSLYDFASSANMSPGGGNGGSNPSTIVASMMEVQRLREENSLHKATLANYEEKLAQAMNLWKREVEEVTRKEKIAESQRDEALNRLSSIQKELELLKCSENAFQTKRLGDLSSMTANQLIQLQNQTRNELKCIEEALLRHQNTA